MKMTFPNEVAIYGETTTPKETPTVKPDNDVNDKSLSNKVDDKIDGRMSIDNESLTLCNGWDNELDSFENNIVTMTNNYNTKI